MHLFVRQHFKKPTQTQQTSNSYSAISDISTRWQLLKYESDLRSDLCKDKQYIITDVFVAQYRHYKLFYLKSV